VAPPKKYFDSNYIHNLMNDDFTYHCPPANRSSEAWGNILKEIDINEPFNCKYLDEL
jgi:hypothetical protein